MHAERRSHNVHGEHALPVFSSSFHRTEHESSGIVHQHVDGAEARGNLPYGCAYLQQVGYIRLHEHTIMPGTGQIFRHLRPLSIGDVEQRYACPFIGQALCCRPPDTRRCSRNHCHRFGKTLHMVSRIPRLKNGYPQKRRRLSAAETWRCDSQANSGSARSSLRGCRELLACNGGAEVARKSEA